MANQEQGKKGTSANDQRSAQETIIAGRKAKAAALREKGENPFANDVDRASLADFGVLREAFASAKGEKGKYDPEAVAKIAAEQGPAHLAGRIVFFRSFGKACFLRLRSRSGEMQVFCRQDTLGEAFGALEGIDLGDHIEAKGPMMVTKTGELSLEATSLRMLTKAYRPLPDKWHGLSDVETRYRQRYVDLIVSKDVSAVFQARSHVVRALRRYLDDAGFLEVETPTLHSIIGGANAKPFNTHHNALDMSLFLRIAPELYLKRLVVGGLERVYEVGRNYRNEGISTRHNPEFTMIEFYEAYANYADLMVRTEEIFRYVDNALQTAMPEAHARWQKERPFTLSEPFKRLPMLDAVLAAQTKAELPADVWENIANEEMPPIKQWAKSSRRAKKEIDWSNFRKAAVKCDSKGELLFCAYEYLAEPFLPEDYRSADGTHSVPVFIVDYPFEVSPLARRKDSDPSLVDRFEIFVDGREVANAFSELNDPEDQAERFRKQVEKKSQGAEETMDYDEDYIRALEYGMPPTAGFGMGIDRLVMLLTNSQSIRDVIFFPLLRPEV